MDPLSIAASIAGLLTITGAIVSKGYAHLSQAKKDKADIANLLNEVASFAGILFGLKTQYTTGTDEATETLPLQWFAPDSAETWQSTLQTCESTLTEIKDIVESLASSNTVRLIVKGVSMTSRAEKLLAQIERFKGLFILCLQLQNNVDSRTRNRQTLEILELLHSLADKQEVLNKKAEAKDQAKLRNKIVDWLRPTPEVVQDDIVSVRDPQSCQWLLERPEFLRWLELENFTGFWLWGIQGSGKTVIVSKVVEAIEDCFLEEDDVAVYHYCRFSDGAALSSKKVIGAIVAQLLTKLPDSIPLPALLSDLSKKYRMRSYPSPDELQDAFIEICQHYSRVFIIVDGLDEILDREEILEFLTNLEIVGGIFKVFVASRPEIDLELVFESYLTVAITQSDVQPDMELYVRQRLEKLQIGDEKDASLELITTELVERAQGMFLWAVCQIDHLSRIRTAITIDVLSTLPRGLEDTFEGILLRLEEEDQSLALDILRVISFSERALDVAEVVEAVAVTPETRDLQQLRSRALRRPNDVFQLCGSLIRKSQTTGKISLSHFSVKEFLSRPLLGKGRQNLFHLQEISSKRSQFEICISYLSLKDFTSDKFRETLRLALDPLYTDTDFQIMDTFPLLDYASNFWVSHLKQLDYEDFQALWPHLRNFLDSKNGSFDSWILISQYSYGDYKFPRGASAIHVAALYGLKVLLARILKADPASRTFQTSDGRTSLHIALENQQEEILDLLLYSDVEYDPLVQKLLMVKDDRGRTPLHTAIESGSEIAVVKLVTAGANVNAVQSDGRTPISVAVENQWDLLSDFLSQKADPKQKLPDGRTLLHVAAESGSLAWATALLKFHKSRLLNAQDENDWTPLHFAMDREHLHIARILVESNCSIEAYDANGWTPLHATIRRRNLACASLILEKDWPPNLKLTSSSYPSRPSPASQSASTSRQQRASRRTRQPAPSSSLHTKYRSERLRDRHYESDSVESSDSEPRRVPNKPKPQQPSPLHLAVKESYTEGVELLAKHRGKLLRLGLDGAENLKCLSMAIESSNIKIILVLLEMLSKWDVEEFLSKLMAMSSDSIDEYLKKTFSSEDIYGNQIPRAYMSQRKKDIPSMIRIWPLAQDAVLQTAVQHRPELAKILIEHGVPASKLALDASEDMVLHRAIAEKDLDLARYIIENGTNLEVRNENGETPLLVISSLQVTKYDHKTQGKYHDLAQLLVAKGVDIHAHDDRLRGICHKAAIAGNDEILDWSLRTLNLDPSSRDQNSRTPLLLAVEHGQLRSIRLLLKQLLANREGSNKVGYTRVADVMEYANMRSAPLLRAMITRPERKISIVSALVSADEHAFQKLSSARQTDLLGLRTAFYLEALTWAIDCDFPDGFTLLLPKVPRAALSSRKNLDGDSIYHVAATAASDEYLKTVLQIPISREEFNGEAFESQNLKEETPLDIVIRRGSKPKFSLLLLYGVKPTGAQLLAAKGKGLK